MKKVFNKRNGSLMLAFILSFATLFSVTGTEKAFAAPVVGNKVTVGTSFSQKAGRTFWDVNDANFTGYCMDGGLDVDSNSQASVQQRVDNSSDMARLLYWLGVNDGWHGDTTKATGTGTDFSKSRYLNILLQVGNYNSSRSWSSVKSAMHEEGYANKTLEDARDYLAAYLAAHPDPAPASFELYICNPKSSSKQRFVLFNHAVSPGYGNLKKASESKTRNFNNHTLAGAVYYVYTTPECTEQATDVATNQPAALTTNASGDTNTVTLTPGDYYVKEVTASQGFLLDPNVITLNIVADQTRTINSTEPVPTGKAKAVKKSGNTDITG